MLDSMINIVESARRHTNSTIKSIQKSLIPEFVDIKYSIRRNYMYNEDLIYDYDRVVIKVDNMKYRSVVVNGKRDLIFRENMKDCVDDKKMFPFLLFINGIHIKWSDITVVRDCKYSYLLVKTDIYYRNILSVKLLHIPFPVIYTETRQERKDMTPIFRFNLDGQLLDNGKVIYYTDFKNIVYKEFTYLNGNLVNEDIDVPAKIKLSTNNFVIFKNKVLINDDSNTLSVRNTNLLNMTGEAAQYRVKMFYRADVNTGIDNTSRIPNELYLKRLMRGQESLSTLDMSTLDKEFNFEFSNKKKYERNIKESMNYMAKYNTKAIADIYEDNRYVFSKQCSGKEIKDMVNLRSQVLTMLRMKYKSKETFVMVFYNGKLYKNYSELQYQLSSFTIPIDIDEVDDTDIFEFVFFKGINNYFETIKLTKDNGFKEQRAFEDDELVLYASDPKELKYNISLSDRSLYKVAFTIDENGVVIPTDPYYYDKDILYTTKNQFRYCFRNIQDKTVKIRLTPDFMGALNPDQYMVFYNGRLMNRLFYRLTIEDRDNTFLEPCIYSRIMFNPGDKVEVVYVPGELNEMDYNQDMTIEIASVVATTNKQTSFMIPFPFKLYTQRNDFIPMIGNIFVNRERYTIENSILTFTDGTFIPEGKKISFLFCYEGSSANESIKYLSESSFISIENNYLDVTIDGQKEFQLDPDYIPTLIKGNALIVTYKGLYIGSEFYTIDRYNGKIIFADNNLKAGTSINVAVCFVPNNSINQTSQIITATQDNTFTFSIPDPFGDYVFKGNTVLMIKNGILATEGYHYTLNENMKTITLNTPLNKDESFKLIGFEYAQSVVKSYDEYLDVTEDGQLEYALGQNFDDYTNQSNKFLVYIGSILVDPRRYSVEKSTLKFNDTIGLKKGRHIRLVFLYIDSASSGSTYNSQGSSRYNKVESISVPLQRGVTKYTVPIDDAIAEDIKFFISAGSVLIDERRYIKNKYNNTIEFIDKTDPMLNNGEDVSLVFNFIYDDMYDINIMEANVPVEFKGQDTFNIPVPFENFFTFKTKLIVFLGSTYVDPSRYDLDMDNLKLIFKDEKWLPPTRDIKFMFVFTNSYKNIAVSDDEVSISKIKKNGFIFMNKNALTNPLSKKLFFMFLNGKKIDLDSIIEISGNLVRINRDIQSRYNLVLLNYTKNIPEMDEFFSSYSDYDTVINNLNPDELNVLFGTHVLINDTEPHHDMNVDKKALIGEIVRDFYVSNGIYDGDVFPYDYDKIDQENSLGEIFPQVQNADENFAVNIDRSDINKID